MPAKKKLPLKKTISPQVNSSSHLPTALVAGAAGFIGSHLCDSLLHQNCQVIGIDNWTTGKKQNIKHLLKNKQFIFEDHDLNRPFESPIPKVDYVFHLAGVEAYLNGIDVSLETLLVNSLGSRELLEISLANKAKFLMVSTIEVFSGFLSGSNIAQLYGTQPRSQEAYSHQEAKRFSEALTFEYINRHQLDARVVRLGHVYGPRMDLKNGHQITQFFLAAKQGRPLPVHAQGLTQLYPTYISDVIYGLTKAMFSQSSANNIYTLANPEKTTALSFAFKLKEVVEDQDLQIEFIPGEEEPEASTLSDKIIESQKNLGWTPNVSLKEGILKTYLFLKEKNIPQTYPTSSTTEASEQSNKTYTASELGITPALVPTSSEQPISQPKTLKPPKLPNLPKLKKPIFKKPKIKFSSFLKPRPINLSLKPKIKKISTRTKLIFAAATLLLTYLFLPLILLAYFTYSGFTSLKSATQITDFAQVSQLEQLTSKAEKNFLLSRKLLSHSHSTIRIFGLKKHGDNLDRLLFIGSKLSQGALHLVKAGDAGTYLSQIVFHHQDGNISEALKRIQINLDQAYSELSFVESDLQSGQQIDLDFTISLAQKLQTLTSELPIIRHKINQIRAILPLIPGFIAQDSKKTYLLLFQNSAELRPTGGFIGSYGLLTFDKGKLLDFSVEDIYSADGQLTGYVKPPDPIDKAFGHNSWFFRDSNWDPDFIVSAQRAEWFLNKTTDRNVDGVIAVNLPAVKELLKATGPINLPDYDEEINTDNLFERAEYRSEIDFFPGSTQKKDFLGSLAREIFDKVQQSSASDLLKFAQSLEASLAQKHLLVYLHDNHGQQILLEQNWAGSLFEPNFSTIDNRPVTSDYFYPIETNLGINKANYFLKRHLKHELTLLKNKEILVVSNLNYQNNSPANAWPGGIYKSYFRTYLPSNARLISVKIGDARLNLSSQIDQEIINTKLVVGFDISVPVKGSLDVEITYRLADSLQMANNLGRLAVVIPKQPGILDDTIELIVNFPTYLTVAATNPVALVSPQVVAFQSDFSLDRLFTIDFVER